MTATAFSCLHPGCFATASYHEKPDGLATGPTLRFPLVCMLCFMGLPLAEQARYERVPKPEPQRALPDPKRLGPGGLARLAGYAAPPGFFLYDKTLEEQWIGPSNTCDFRFQPNVPLKLTCVSLTAHFGTKRREPEELDIEYVRVGNLILAAYSQRIPVCLPEMVISVTVSSYAPKPILTGVRLEGVSSENPYP